MALTSSDPTLDDVFSRLPISVVIPTYRRESVLIDTLRYLLALRPAPYEILVLDQTETHDAATTEKLKSFANLGLIRWVRLTEPSIPKTMNEGLRLASQDLVLFVDDDIEPEPTLISGHINVHAEFGTRDILVAGRVIQPWQEATDFSKGTTFHFACIQRQWINEFMGGNFSINRITALSIGGFDENFVRVAYRFEAEFAHRFCKAGNRILFEPLACLHHLKDMSGGTRAFGNHLSTWRPDHAVGAYYYGLRTAQWRKLIMRPLRAITTRHHLRHPWQMLGTLFAECRGMVWAWKLHKTGPRYSGPQAIESKRE